MKITTSLFFLFLAGATATGSEQQQEPAGAKSMLRKLGGGGSVDDATCRAEWKDRCKGDYGCGDKRCFMMGCDAQSNGNYDCDRVMFTCDQIYKLEYVNEENLDCNDEVRYRLPGATATGRCCKGM